MNPYMPLSPRNVHQNNIPPRLMWNVNDNVWTNTTSGYCGETSLQCTGLFYGQYVPQFMIRDFVADYFANMTNEQFDKDFPGSLSISSPENQHETVHLGPENIKRYGQYCCQFLLDQPGSSYGMHYVLEKLRFAINTETDIYTGSAPTQAAFIPWVKQRVLEGIPVITGVQDNLPGSDDIEYDHIIIVTGWGSNQPFNDYSYQADDEILFSDHGLVTTGGSMPYYFHYVMETDGDGTRPDGGCPGTKVWNFILDLGRSRHIDNHPCNTYQLAQVPSAIANHTPNNYALALRGVMGSNLLPVRIDTDFNYEIPCITTKQAWNGPYQPPQPSAVRQKMTHTITVSGMVAGNVYNIWVYKELTQVPTDNFNTSSNGTCIKHTAAGETYSFTLDEYADIPVIVRCVPMGA